MRVVIVCAEDYANVGYNLAEALNRHTDHEAACVTRNRHQFGYPHGLQLNRDPADKIREWTETADVVIVKDDRIRPEDVGVHVNPNAKRICTVEGIIFRDNWERHSEAARVYSDARVAFMADVNRPSLDATYIPAPIDTDRFSYLWEDRSPPVVCHSPSGNRRFKGTDTIFIPAVERLQRQGMSFDLDIIHGVRWSMCMDRKRRGSVFFDQADWRIGTYGVSSIESMAFGLPTISYLSDVAIQQSKGIHDDCPIINVRPTVDSVADAIESLLTNDLSALSLKTREWCVATHGYKAVASRWDNLIGGLA